MADPSRALVLGRVIEVQETVDGLKARCQRLDRKKGIETDWLAIAGPMASAESGFKFQPQIDTDIAVIAYTQKKGIILGFIYGPNSVASDDPTELSITSRDGNTVILHDGDASGITLRDKHANEIVMNADGITIKTDGVFKVEAGSDATIEASGTTTIVGATVELNP
jgi:hypothetical protein